jgi:hypothetical protein
MLRRGIPYGPPHDPTKLTEDDDVDRGLLFMAYQAVIGDQFQFVTQTWVNRPNSPHDSDPQMGLDPLIGQASARFIRLPLDDEPSDDRQMDLPTDPWVVMTGGGYFFTPSVSALGGVLAGMAAASPVVAPTQGVRAKPRRVRRAARAAPRRAGKKTGRRR